MTNKQQGFSIVEVVIVACVLALVVGIGWLVYDRQKAKSNDVAAKTETAQQETKEDMPAQSQPAAPENDIIRKVDIRLQTEADLARLTNFVQYSHTHLCCRYSPFCFLVPSSSPLV